MKLKRMAIFWVLAAATLPVLGQTPAATAPARVKSDAGAVKALGLAGPYEVRTVALDWTDLNRKRDVPVRIYYPAAGRLPGPVIIFSHGLGGSRDMYEYLGRHWAGWGYVSVHLQHKGSDSGVWKGTIRPITAMRQAAADPANAINRPLDVRFAIDRLTKLNASDGPLKGQMDLARIGAAGHSFGAFTTLAVAGQVFTLPGRNDVTFGDKRIKAAMPMSAPVPVEKGQLDKAYGGIKIPCMHMTGTKDKSRIGQTTAQQRRLPYDHSRGIDRYLIVLAGGDHMVFSGRKRWYGKPSKTDVRFHELIRISSVLFWDAYLKDDPKARRRLSDGTLKAALAGAATYERKLKDASD